MKNGSFAIVAAAVLFLPMAANAAQVTYNFTVNGGTTGPLAGVTSSGYFSFDDSIIPVGGGILNQAGLISDLSFSWNGIAYDEISANIGVLTFDAANNLTTQSAIGNNCGAGICSVSNTVANQWFINWNGAQTSNFPYSRDNTIYQGDSAFPIRGSAVAEPGTIALLGFGLAGLGFARRKRTG
jgi:hypothetical protein